MGFVEETISKAKELAAKTGEVAVDVIAIQKLRIKVINLKNELSKNYELLGKYVYDEKADNKDNAEAISALVEVITKIKNDIEETNKEIVISKGGKLCECGEINSDTSKFCNKCGKEF